MGYSLGIRAALAVALCMPLPGCESFGSKPIELADRTVADERTAIALELAYTAATRAGTTLARAGIVDAARFGEMDAKAYTALLAVRATYQAGNADAYALAVYDLQAAIAEINTLLGRVS